MEKHFDHRGLGGEYLGLPPSLRAGYQGNTGDDDGVAARSTIHKQNSKTSVHNRPKARAQRSLTKLRTKAGITLDTSVTRHKGSEPRQLYAEDTDSPTVGTNDVGSMSRINWWNKGRSVRRVRNGSDTLRADASRSRDGNEDPMIDGKNVTTTTEANNTRQPLRPVPFPLIDISPSVRAIPIGFSVPSSKLSEHDTSPDTADVATYSRQLPLKRAASQTTPQTPTILITPAREESGWNFLPQRQPADHRARPASSVYSRPALFMPHVPEHGIAPPVPALPTIATQNPNTLAWLEKQRLAHIMATPVAEEQDDTQSAYRRDRESVMTEFEDDNEPVHGGRFQKGLSVNTLFEEDTTPNSAHTRYIRSPNGTTLEAVPPTPRRSRGWWNVITTPFEVTKASQKYPGAFSRDTTPDIPQSPWQHTAAPPLAGAAAGVAVVDAIAAKDLASPKPTDIEDERSPLVETESERPDRWSSSVSSVRHSFETHHSLVPLVPLPPTQRHEEPSLPNIVRGQSVSPLTASDKDPPDALPAARSAAPAIAAATSSQPGYFDLPQTPRNGATPAGGDVISPLSREAQYTPVVEVASIGTIIAPRTVQPNEPTERSLPPQRVTQFPTGLNASYYNPSPRTQPPAMAAAPNEERSASLPPPAYSRYPTVRSDYYENPPRNPPPPVVPFQSHPNRTKEAVPKGHGGSWTLKELFSCGNRKQRRLSEKSKQRTLNEKKKRKKRRRCLWGCCCILLLLVVLLVVLLVMLIPRKHADMPVQSQWLNLTGFPPIPTGIATIAQPNAVVENTSCVQPATMWSCALPKEQQQSIKPNLPDQPNFRIEIRFRNGTGANASQLQPTSSRKRSNGPLGPMSATSFLRHVLLRTRDSFTDQLYNSSPAPPSTEDQDFLGNTTDGVLQPFNGEHTPFYISFIDPTPTTSPSKLLKRATSTNSTNSTTDPFPSLSSFIPSASKNGDGTAASATLLPLPSAQPLRLYNKGLSSEHYGFYTYFDRSIFLKGDGWTFNSSGLVADVPADHDGGSTFASAAMRCTWSQTRFLVQIWTKSNATKTLLPAPAGASSSAPASTATATATSNSSSANVFTRPGSFPYPVTITVDRHGGSLKDKMIYCYGMDASGKIIDSLKVLQVEDRFAGGNAVNGVSGPFDNKTVAIGDGGPGGIDGGTAGCGCKWQNFV